MLRFEALTGLRPGNTNNRKACRASRWTRFEKIPAGRMAGGDTIKIHSVPLERRFIGFW